MKERFKILLVSCLMVVAGCIDRALPLDYEQTAMVTSTSQPDTRTPLPSSTNSPPSASPTITIVPSVTPEPGPNVTQNCLTIQTSLPTQHHYRGAIAFESFGPEVTDHISFYDLLTDEFTNIPGMDYHRLLVSPDNTMYASKDIRMNKLEVFASNKKLLQSISWGKDWGNIAGWLDNQRLVIILSEDESPELPNFDKYPRKVLIVNPFNEQIQILPPDYPHIDQASRMTSWGNYGTTIYSPDLSRVVYPGSMQLEEYGGMGYILYGIPEGKELAHLPSGYWNQLPLWSKDGSQFLVMGDSDFYLVSKDGQVSQVSQMNPGYHPPQKTTHNYYLYYYSWSPDERQVALWLIDEGTGKITLAVLDLRTGIVTDTCIPAGYNPLDIRTLPYPVWSPDGKSLVVAANYRPEEDEFDVVLVDLQEQTAYKIATNRYPVGWLITQ